MPGSKCGHLFWPTCGCDEIAPPPAAPPAPAASASALADFFTPEEPPAPRPPAPVDQKLVEAVNERIHDRALVPAPLPPEVVAAPAPQEQTHAGPAPKKTWKRGRKKSPWLVRAQAEQAARSAEPDFADQIIEMALDPEGREDLLKRLKAEHAKVSFAEFFRQAWKVLEPATDLVWNWHLDLLCGVAQAVFFDWMHAKRDSKYVNKIRNVLVNLPPGSSKSRCFSVAFQAWCWLHWPGMKFINLSVNDDAAMRDARAMRDLVRSPWYVDSFKVSWTIKGDQDAISNFGNSEGGERLSMPSRSVVVGLRADLITIDDANDPSENSKERAEVNFVWDTTQSNRVNDMQRSLRFGVQQRTGLEDWSDHVTTLQGTWSPDNLSGWLHVVLPAEYEASRRFVMPDHLANILREQLLPEDLVLADPRTEEGESIDELRMPKSALADERKRLEGTGAYFAQMQQRPMTLEGGRVKNHYWGWCRLARGVRPEIDERDNGRPRPAGCHTGDAITVKPKHLHPAIWDFDWVVVSLDCAAKKTERGSNWGILVIAGQEGRRFVLDDRTRRGDILEIIDVLRELVRLWRPDRILIEDKAAGPDLKLRLLTEMTRGDMPMITIEDVQPGAQGKEERLDSCLPVIANGLVYLLDGAPWLQDFVEELAVFPHGPRNDRVDALSQALNHFAASDEFDVWPDFA